MDANDVFDAYLNEHFTSTESNRGLRNLEHLCEVLGYGQGFMSNRAIEDFLIDNPGAIEAIVEFVRTCVPRNSEWQENLASVVGDDECVEEYEAD